MDIRKMVKKGNIHSQRGKGNTVIDYVLGDEKVRGKMERLRIGERIDSDYHPVDLLIKWKGQGEEERGKWRKNRSGREV